MIFRILPGPESDLPRAYPLNFVKICVRIFRINTKREKKRVCFRTLVRGPKCFFGSLAFSFTGRNGKKMRCMLSIQDPSFCPINLSNHGVSLIFAQEKLRKMERLTALNWDLTRFSRSGCRGMLVLRSASPPSGSAPSRTTTAEGRKPHSGSGRKTNCLLPEFKRNNVGNKLP